MLSMLSFEARIKSFKSTFMLEGKKYRWRYTLISSEAMAKLGFFYNPTKDENSGEVHKDAVGCCFCKRITYNLGGCRSKKKDTVETMISVLRQHLLSHNSQCLMSYLKLRALEDFSSGSKRTDWESDKYLSNPLDKEMEDFREFTFAGNWSHTDEVLLPKNMASSGLIRYDSSYTGFEDLMDNDATDACYCVYCKKVMVSWQSNDNPLWEHYKSCNGGQCHFFQTLEKKNKVLVDELRNRYDILNKEAQESCDSIHMDSSSVSVTPSNPRPVSDTSFEPEDGEIIRNVLPVGPGDIQKDVLRSTSVSPRKKKRKLKSISTAKLSDDEICDEQSSNHGDKDLVIKFKEHIERVKDVGRKNKILDDSKDDFSFDAHGHSTFEIPLTSTVLPVKDVPGSKNFLDDIDDESMSGTSPNKSANDELEPPQSFKLSNGLDRIPTDVDLSTDVSSMNSSNSTPIQSPKLEGKAQIDLPSSAHFHLRHYRRYQNY